MTQELPAEVVTLLKGFCAAKQTGSLVLDIKDGRVLSVKSTVAIQVKIDNKDK